MTGYLKRLVEQVLVAAGGAFGAALAVDGNLTTAALAAAVAAGLRAGYGVVVKRFGEPERPEVL